MDFDASLLVTMSYSNVKLALETLRVGDTICLLLCCSLPAILSLLDTHFVFRGAAYVDEYIWERYG